MDTGGRKWGSPYLNREFFDLLHERMADKCLLILAMDGKTPDRRRAQHDRIGHALWPLLGPQRRPTLPAFRDLLLPGHRLRHRARPCRVEAGAQGEHKLARGYEPRLTRSAHWIAHSGLRHAVADYLDSERAAVEKGIDELQRLLALPQGRRVRQPEEHDEESF